MSEPKAPFDFAACGRCGSGLVHPRLLTMGPLPWVDSERYVYVCHACGHVGLPVFFETAEARAEYERAKQSPPRRPEAPKRPPSSIPILPIDTRPILDAKILEALPIRLAYVVGVRWDGLALQPTPYRVSFAEYWTAIGGPRYNASQVFMLDLEGVRRGDPNFDILRELVKRCDVWLDLGARDSDDAMDGYMLDVERVVAGSKTLSSLEAFTDLHRLSPSILPCLDWDGQVLWGSPREKRVILEEVAEALQAIGFSSLCVMDLRRLGTEAGPDPGLLASLERLALEVYLGGGIRETDVPALQARGLAGGLVDPFTPIIRDLLQRPVAEAPAEAPGPAPKPQRKPAPGSVPDSG